MSTKKLEKKLAEDLRAWFGKGKKGGAGGGGWDRYNTKGERIGKCGEKKPGEGKPKCLSKSKAASLRASGGKKAIAAAVNKKRREDPNPNRKGSADMVSNKVKKTNESKLFESEQRMKKAYIELSKELLNPNTNDIRREAIQRQIIELQQLAKRFGINLQKDSLQTFVENFECPHCHGLMYSESMITEEGKKDACYHKVKSRYKIWPSAYASGALVKCRKAGASNWGNKSKKNEDVELDESLKNKLAAAGVAATMALSPAHARVTDGGQSFAQQTAQQSSQHQSVKIPKQIPSKSYLQNVASGKSRSLMDPDTAKELLKKYYK